MAKEKKPQKLSDVKVKLPPYMRPFGPVFTEVALSLAGNLDTLELNASSVYKILDKFCYDVMDGQIAKLPVDSFAMSAMLGRRWWSDVPEFISAPCTQGGVMILTNRIVEEEHLTQHLPGGDLREYLSNRFELMGIDPSQWYVTALFKHLHPDYANGGNVLKKAWLKEFEPLLDREIARVRPDVVFVFGAEPAKFMLRDKDAKIGDIEGTVNTVLWPELSAFESARDSADVGVLEFDDDPPMFPIKVVCMTHPRSCLRSKSAADKQKLANAIAQMANVVSGEDRQEAVEHYAVRTIDELAALAKRVENECENNLIAIDAEWNSDHPQNDDWYVRTVQLSWKPNTAAAVVFHNEKGEPCFGDDYQKAISMLADMLRGHQIAGHYLDADLEHLEAMGIPALSMYAVHESAELYKEAVLSDSPCGFDTALAAHALEETDSFSLTAQFLKHTTAPRYDLEVEKFTKQYSRSALDNKKLINKYLAANPNSKWEGKVIPPLTGYGPVPDDILVPYGCYDADVTRRIAMKQRLLLSSDRFHHDCWLPFWRNMRVVPAVLEMKVTGIHVDRDHMMNMMRSYGDMLRKNICEIRKYAGFESFNPNSLLHLRWFVFGYGSAPILDTGEEAFTMRLDPVLTTGTRGRPWAEVIADGDVERSVPSVSQQVLSTLLYTAEKQILYKDGDDIALRSCKEPISILRNISALRKVLETVLRLPDTEIHNGEDSDVEYGWDKGLPSFICKDDRVRTTIYTTKETGRYSSARPPLQNISKTKEVIYKEAMGDAYIAPLRSVLTADPGYVLVSTDFAGAELTVAAILSKDDTMLDNVMRNQLPEDDPDFYDIHSSVAVSAFKLDCKPTKHGLKEAGVYHYRHLAKSVMFGIMYGRGAKAISQAALADGIFVSAEEAQTVIDAVYSKYAGLRRLFDDCKDRVEKYGWLKTAYGRYRRFFPSANKKELSANSREAMNFPVQGFVADAVSTAISNFYYCRPQFNCEYYLVLQIHDEIISLVKETDLKKYIKEVVPFCMRERLPLYGSDLAGRHYAEGPYFFGNESSVFRRWGEEIPKKEFEALMS